MKENGRQLSIGENRVCLIANRNAKQHGRGWEYPVGEFNEACCDPASGRTRKKRAEEEDTEVEGVEEMGVGKEDGADPYL